MISLKMPDDGFDGVTALAEIALRLLASPEWRSIWSGL
jgi:hypothetical protein